jgi:hypothetical protein
MCLHLITLFCLTDDCGNIADMQVTERKGSLASSTNFTGRSHASNRIVPAAVRCRSPVGIGLDPPALTRMRSSDFP